ncbi:MAG: YicC family protein [Omnitrophica WOR_2 bacterium GWA2_47_8]|nr:MAG: YicC family protein [Omnitrophica WOR_2 bacterium GWA2_47_8]
MIKGMTGFGSAQFSAGKIKGTVEIKSFNHRYLDVTFYSPAGFSSIENKVRELVDKQVNRGKLTVSFRITHKPSAEVVLNRDVLRQYLKHARALKKDFPIKDELSISDLTQLPGVIEIKESSWEPEHAWPTLEQAFIRSLNGLTQMRIREGKSLSADIRRQAADMQSQIKLIEKRDKAILVVQRKQLTEEEYVSFQKSNDVNEELARLSHFIEELKGSLNGKGPSGKNIDFIAQEMQREANTIGSKLQDKIVTTAVIALKSKIEKIREQAQNIE